MKNIVLTIFTLVLFQQVSAQGRIDTVYYNKHWRGVPNKMFADYQFFTFEPQDSLYAKQYRGFYMSGELHSEGEYIHIDAYDAYNNIYEKERVVYSKEGEIVEREFYKDGCLDGDAFYVNEDGSKDYVYYENGKLADSFIWRQYANGALIKYDPFEDCIIKDTPTNKDLQVVINDGVTWKFYCMNGILIAVAAERIKEYGRYIQLSVLITNYSPREFEFGVNNINVTFNYYNNKGEERGKVYAGVLDKSQYTKRIKNRQTWSEIGAGLLLGLSSAASNMSGMYDRTINTTVSTPYGTSTIKTTYFDYGASYRDIDRNAALLASQSYQHANDLERLSVGYLTENTVMQNQEITGFVMIPDDSPQYGAQREIICYVEVDGVQYVINL